jgi:hypothetical protein
MNNDFIAHVIRDVFPKRSYTVIYGSDEELKNTLSKPEHSIGAYQFHTERDPKLKDSFYYRFWEIGINNPYINYGETDLFISINYNPTVYPVDKSPIGFQVKKLLKNGGKAMLVNPGAWSEKIDLFMSLDNNSIKEIKRYSMFKNENVLVYENI